VADGDAFLAKAEESLTSAEDDFSKERFNSCARNSYYAAFQAAVAALSLERIRPSGSRWSHEFVHAQFGGMLVYRRKLYDAAHRTVLDDSFRMRVDADYTEKHMRDREVSRALSRIRGMFADVKERLDGHR
jgi:uncharacterized protein (UPF0332 family)